MNRRLVKQEELLLEQGRLTTAMSIIMGILAEESRKGRTEWAASQRDRLHDALMGVKVENTTPAKAPEERQDPNIRLKKLIAAFSEKFGEGDDDSSIYLDEYGYINVEIIISKDSMLSICLTDGRVYVAAMVSGETAEAAYDPETP